MMKKILFILFSIALLAACGGQSEEPEENNHVEDESHGNHGDSDHDHEDMEEVVDSLIPLIVEINMEDSISVGETTLSATVTHNDTPVTEADRVRFEVWKDGDKDNSEMIEGTHVEDGVYEAEYTFNESGTFFVQAHVDALHQHVMPVHEFVVQ